METNIVIDLAVSRFNIPGLGALVEYLTVKVGDTQVSAEPWYRTLRTCNLGNVCSRPYDQPVSRSAVQVTSKVKVHSR
jgi:hypothetical protein